MKHPALARMFSIALAILCLIMLLAGAFGITGAREDNRDTLASYDRLQARIEEYNTVTMALEGTISYEEANKTLQEKQDQYDEDASQHRNDLAMHTATHGGLLMGADALWEAQAALDAGWEQYNAGVAQLEDMEKQLTAGRQQLDMGKAALDGMKAQLEGANLEVVIKGLLFESGLGNAVDTLSRIELEPDGTVGGDTEGGGTTGGETPPPTTDPEEGEQEGGSGDGGTEGGGSEGEGSDNDNTGGGGTTGGGSEGEGSDNDNTGGGNTGTGGQGSDNQDNTGGKGDGSTEGDKLTDSGVDDGSANALIAKSGVSHVSLLRSPTAMQLKPMLLAASGTDEGDGDSASEPSLTVAAATEAYTALITACATYNGTIDSIMSNPLVPESMGALFPLFPNVFSTIAMEEIYAVMNTWTEDPLSGDVMNRTISIFEKYKGIVTDKTKELSNLPSTLNDYLEAQTNDLAVADQKLRGLELILEQGKAALPLGKAALEMGDAQLYEGFTTIWYNLGQLDEESEELRLEKETLEKELEELTVMIEQTRQQRDLEKRQTSLRVMLLDRDGIEERYKGGMDLIDSAKAYSEELLSQAENEYQTRFIACILMIIGGLAGILHIPSAFEKIKSRFVLIVPVLVCLGCAAAAEYIFEAMGRGSSYSAIFAGIFAVIQLLVVIPRTKKPVAGV